jgi:hypothetical protein
LGGGGGAVARPRAPQPYRVFAPARKDKGQERRLAFLAWLAKE